MWLILLLLSLTPLLSLPPLFWYRSTGQRCCATKAACLSFSGSLFWGLLAAYVCAQRPNCAWLYYPILTSGFCLFAVCLKPVGRLLWLRRCLALAAFYLVFILSGYLVPDWTSVKPQDQSVTVSALSQFQGTWR